MNICVVSKPYKREKHGFFGGLYKREKHWFFLWVAGGGGVGPKAACTEHFCEFGCHLLGGREGGAGGVAPGTEHFCEFGCYLHCFICVVSKL